MDFVDFTAGSDDNDRRLDKVIRIFASNLPLTEIYKAIRKGLIKVNDKKSSQSDHVKKGDKISIAKFLIQDKKEENSTSTPLEKLPPVIFQNKDLIIFNKPYNLLVQPNGTDEISLNTIVQAFYEQKKDNDSISFKTGPLHRLDKKTSGLICFSWSLDGAKWFTKNIIDHKITKKYRGIIQGNLQKEEIWEDYISKEFEKDKKFQTVKIQKKEQTNACTKVTPLAHGKYNDTEITYVEFDIKTGKTHQIRAQSSFHGYPLLGDTAYKAKKQNMEREYFLHAYELCFPPNELALPPKITCPLSKDFGDLVLKTCDIKNFSL